MTSQFENQSKNYTIKLETFRMMVITSYLLSIQYLYVEKNSDITTTKQVHVMREFWRMQRIKERVTKDSIQAVLYYHHFSHKEYCIKVE